MKAANIADLISQAEAARLRNVTRTAIRNLVRKGRLRTMDVGGRTLVYRSDVLSYKPAKGGRPANQKAWKLQG